MTNLEKFTDSNGNQKSLKFRFSRESRKRYKAPDLPTLEADDYTLLKEMIEHHRTFQAPRIQELEDYAVGDNHAILTDEYRRNESDMSDARVSHNFGGFISSIEVGYNVGKPIKIEYIDPDATDEDIKTIQDFIDTVSRDNDSTQLDRSLFASLSETGRSFDITYYNQDDKIKIRKLDPKETFVIFDYSLTQHSIAAVRYFRNHPSEEHRERVELYTPTKIYRFDYNGEALEPAVNSNGDSIDEDLYLGQVSITETKRNERAIGSFEPVLNLIDAYDARQSDVTNFMTDLVDSILAIFGNVSFQDSMTSDEQLEWMKKMRHARLMHLSPPLDDTHRDAGQVDARYLTKTYDSAGTKDFLDRLEADIHKFTHTPNYSDESFGGQQSGVALEYKMNSLANESLNVQAQYEKSLRRRFEMIGFLGVKSGKVPFFDVNKLKITFTPGIPQALSEKIKNLVDLGGRVSNETALRVSNVVEDIQLEETLLAEDDVRGSRLLQQLQQAQRMTDDALVGGADGQEE